MINYIVSLYFGQRRNTMVQSCVDADPYYLFKCHLQAIARYSMKDVHKFTFVVNPSGDQELDEGSKKILEVFSNTPKLKEKNIEILFNPDNRHISYGAWNFGVENGLDDPKTKYFFLLEDDYVPTGDEFYEPYVKKSQDDIAYVCQMWSPSKNPKAKTAGRVAITNGLLNADAARKSKELNGSCFDLPETPDYKQLSNSKVMSDINKKYILCGVAQNFFIRHFLNMGMRIVDLGEGWSQLFLDSTGVKPYKEGQVSYIAPIHEYREIDMGEFHGD
jgi:hypothetical protein